MDDHRVRLDDRLTRRIEHADREFWPNPGIPVAPAIGHGTRGDHQRQSPERARPHQRSERTAARAHLHCLVADRHRTLIGAALD